MSNTLKSRPTNSTPTPQVSAQDSFGQYLRQPAVIVAEIVGAVGLAGTAYIHLAEFSGKFSEVPYLGIGYLLLTAACVVSMVMIAARRGIGWYLGGATALATFVGFVLTRTVGLPGSTDDIGNWSEKIGTYSLIAEALVIVAAAAMIALHLRKPALAN